MASLSILPQAMRSAASATKSLAASTSMRLLSLSSRPALPLVSAFSSSFSPAQTRFLSQTTMTTTTTRPTIGGVAAAGFRMQLLQQTRGMKVRSAIKKRCEHCKVSSSQRFGRLFFFSFWTSLMPDSPVSLQVVRRKANKRHNGYRYIICPANPRHKQRQG